MDDAVLLLPDFQNPGRVTMFHEGRELNMWIEDAEIYKDRFERLKLLPNMNDGVKRRCHQRLCQIFPAFRANPAGRHIAHESAKISIGIDMFSSVQCVVDQLWQTPSRY